MKYRARLELEIQTSRESSIRTVKSGSVRGRRTVEHVVETSERGRSSFVTSARLIL